MVKDSQTANESTVEPYNLAMKIEAKAIEFLYPIELALMVNKWPDDMRLIMWETIARKANTYAARCK